MNKAHLLIVAGDPSADQHASAVIAALRRLVPDLRVSALGGSRLQKASDQFLFPLVAVGGFGFWEPILKIPALLRAMRAVRVCLRSDRPDLVVPVDYYGFNIRVARRAKAAGIPVVYYISPQVWASR